MKMNVKEIAARKERLAPGHRLCPGCAAPMIVRQTLKAIKQDVVIANATGCLEVSTTIYPYSSWRVPWIHNAFENAAVTISGVETMYRALKKKGKIKKDIKFIAFGGDGGTYDIGLQSLSGALERGHDFLYICYDNGAYMNCLSRDTFVMTQDGLKKITDIKTGDPVYAFNQKTGDLVIKKCTGVFDNGVKKVYELKTLHHSIKATANHPFLVVKRGGRGKDGKLEWKTVEKLKNNDEVVVLKNSLKGKSFKLAPVNISKKGDYKVNRLNLVSIPKKTSPDLMELLGLYVGDGWIREEKGEVGFALPKGVKGRNRAESLLKSIFKAKLSNKFHDYIYLYSVNAARFINSLGFGKNAREKLIPPWVFTLPDNEKEAFVKGLMLSDGYTIGKSLRYVSASMDLLKTLRLLLQTIKYRVGKIHQQKKKKGTFVVYRQLLEDSTYGYICFSKPKGADLKKFKSQVKQRNFLAGNENFATEKITSIEYVKEEPTLDLRVEGEHNFVADGIVVHNTGIQRSSATPRGAWTNTSQVGKAIQGKQEFKKDLTAVVIAHHIPYVATATPANYIDLMKKVEKAINTPGPAFMNILSPCPRGWRFPANLTISMCKLAVETGFWPLFEYENGKYTLNFDPTKKKKPISEWIDSQGRYRHFKGNKKFAAEIQADVDRKIDELKWLASRK